jgi:hypothetical protein
MQASSQAMHSAVVIQVTQENRTGKRKLMQPAHIAVHLNHIVLQHDGN